MRAQQPFFAGSSVISPARRVDQPLGAAPGAQAVPAARSCLRAGRPRAVPAARSCLRAGRPRAAPAARRGGTDAASSMSNAPVAVPTADDECQQGVVAPESGPGVELGRPVRLGVRGDLVGELPWLACLPSGGFWPAGSLTRPRSSPASPVAYLTE